MKPLKVRRWTDAVYDVGIFLLKGPGEDARRWINRTFDDGTDVGRFMGAKTCWVDHDRGCALVIWLPEWWDIKSSKHLGVLAHETQHGAVFTMRSRGLVLTPESEEAFAYHQAWLFRECHKRLGAM